MTTVSQIFNFESTGPSSQRDYFNAYTSETFQTASDLNHINAGETEQLEKIDGLVAEYIAGMNKSLITVNTDNIKQDNRQSTISVRV
jgi:hypothetical protein